MILRPTAVTASQLKTRWQSFSPHVLAPQHPKHRDLRTLAIETSCDDTAVAVLDFWVDKRAKPCIERANLIFHKKITSRNQQYGGVHPIVSLESHQENLAKLVQEGMELAKRRVDFVSVTRGPGMRSNLQTGLDVAKGVAVALNIPLVAVHHMQAHALTPRLLSVLMAQKEENGSRVDYGTQSEHSQPHFPFLSLLVSGGHTILIHSQSLVSHDILATTADTAIGDCLDKVARAILPSSLLATSKSTMYGSLLETFAFDDDHGDQYDYEAPQSLSQELRPRETVHGWSLTPPFANSPGSKKGTSMQFSFTGLATSAERVANAIAQKAAGPNQLSERRTLAREVMRVAFEHLASRAILGLDLLANDDADPGQRIKTLVVSGGVAANGYLRHILSKCLFARGYGDIELVFPPPEYCTDNAAMIAWAGSEMFVAGHRSELSVRSIRRWPLEQLLTPPA